MPRAPHQACLELAASDVRGGVIERRGHWIGEEECPDFTGEQLIEFVGESDAVDGNDLNTSADDTA
jgi:hypothetical protein